MFVVGTAGHVDHGKSTLVQALTGIDPDRLKAEKERGMTIDLGFAWLQLPSGNEVSIVDVPGHERFVNNMLAGVGGIDLALLVVAADEAVMPQTREHLAILDLLHVNRGVVAVTKRDLVDEDWLELVMADIEELMEGTALEGSPIIAVSAVTQEGIEDLVSTIDSLLQQTEPKRDLGRPRLPIDRSFAMSGFGTVVTGTLIDGTLDVGQEADLVLSGRKTRVRGLQAHRKRLDQAEPGRRVAANLAGVPHDGIARGEVLTTPGWLSPTTAVDVRLRVLDQAPGHLKHNMHVTLHTGSSEVVGRLRLLEGDRIEPGAATWGQIKLGSPVAAARGDYFVIRSNQTTLGGGSIVETHAKRHRRSYTPTLNRLAVMEQGSDRDVLLATIASSEPAEFTSVVNRANLQPAAARAALKAMAGEKLVVVVGDRPPGPGVRMYTGAGWAASVARASGVPGRLSPAIPPKNRSAQGGAPEQNGNDPSDLQRCDAAAQGRGGAGRAGHARARRGPPARPHRGRPEDHPGIHRAAGSISLFPSFGLRYRCGAAEPAGGPGKGRESKRQCRVRRLRIQRND